MEQYDFYKDSGVEWIGEIPEHWEVKRLKNISISIQTGGTPKTSIQKYYENGTIKWYSPSCFSDSLVLKEPAKLINESALYDNELKLMPALSVLMIGIGATIGKVGIVTEEASSNQQINSITFNQNIVEPYFGAYFLKTYEKEIIRIANFATLPIFNQFQTGSLSIPLPEPAEQKAIVLYLDDHTQKLDRLIKNKKKQIARLKELRQIEINQAVTKGLNPDAPLKDSGVEWLGQIPEHWEVKRLKAVTKINAETLSEKTPADFDFNYVDIGCVNSIGEISDVQQYIFAQAPSRARRIVKKDDVIVSTVRTYLRAIAFIDDKYKDAIVSTGFAVVSADKRIAYPKYLYYQITNEPFIQSIVSKSLGVSYPAINSEVLAALQVFLPDFEVQKAIALHLDKYTSAIDQTIANLEAQISQLQEVRKIEIFNAVTGKVKVPARYFEQEAAFV